jgi:hypothetical protein
VANRGGPSHLSGHVGQGGPGHTGSGWAGEMPTCPHGSPAGRPAPAVEQGFRGEEGQGRGAAANPEHEAGLGGGRGGRAMANRGGGAWAPAGKAATLATIPAIPRRFLCWGGRGQRGRPAGHTIGARGCPERRLRMAAMAARVRARAGKRARERGRRNRGGRRGAAGMLQGLPRLGTAKQEVASGGLGAATHLLKVRDKGGFSENPLAL